jgi:pyruvate dehydrogenase E1 component alpha subunit
VADANTEKYRTKEEIQKYQETMDPISVFQKTLLEEKVLTDKKTEGN